MREVPVVSRSDLYKAAISTLLTVVALACTLAWPSSAQEGAGKAKGKGKGKAVPERPVEPVPRWADGHPNLGSAPGKKGFWEIRPGAAGVPRPDTIPFQPWAKAVYEYRQATNTQDSPLVDCKASSGPSFMNAPGFEIVEVPEQKSIFIMNIAGSHSWRVIYMDGRQHPPAEDLRSTFLGHSIGHWEGEALVIDTVGFNEKQWLVGSYPTTEQLHLTEKFTRPTLGSITYEATIDDPGAYTKPWTATMNINERGLSRFANNSDIFEYICEDNR